MPVYAAAKVVEVFAPATIANLGPGFDILGMAVAEPHDVIRAERIDRTEDMPPVMIDFITGDDGKLPREIEKNTVSIAAALVLQQLMIESATIVLTIQKGLPLESGMGSSAAGAVGGAVAANALFGNSLRREELIPACVEAEAMVSGRHADNVAPGLLGGITLITGLTPDAIYRLPTPENLVLALVTPEVSVPTAEARAVLPKSIPMAYLVRQTSSVALLVSAIHQGNVPLMAQAMEKDFIVESARKSMMPGLDEIRAAAKKVGALGTIISGAGPTLCSICRTTNVARRVVEAMESVYSTMGIRAEAMVTTPSLDGATVRVLET